MRATGLNMPKSVVITISRFVPCRRLHGEERYAPIPSERDVVGTSEQHDSVEVFMTALASVPSDAPTACTEWTAHNVATHLAAGVEERNVLIEDALASRPSRDTRSFAEREAPYLAMPDDTLRERLHETLMIGAKVLADFRAAGLDAIVEFTAQRSRQLR